MSQSRKTNLCLDRAGKHYHQALKCVNDNNFGLALGNLLLFIKLCPEKAPELQSTVTICLENAAQWLENSGRHQELLKIYESVLEVFPDSGKIINALGDFLFRHGHVLQAAAHYLRAARADRRLVVALDNLDRANARLVDRWHFTMLNDARRNSTYGRAVRSAAGRLTDTDLVLDVGTGTALLSMMAAQAGTCTVYACESSEAMCQVAVAALADNAMERRVQLINKWSHQLTVGQDLPRRASLLVTETFDAGLLGEHVLSTVQHAWRHLLLPPGHGAGHGRVLPASATVWAAAVQSGELRSQLTGRLPCGARLRRRLTEPYWSERLDDLPGGYSLLSEHVQVYSVDFNDPESVDRGVSGVEARHVTRCTAAGRLDALVTWFELQLGDGEVLSSAPGEGTCWEQAVYPVPEGRAVQPGQMLSLRTLCRGHLDLQLDDVEADDGYGRDDARAAKATEAGEPLTSAEEAAEAAEACKVAAADVGTSVAVRRTAGCDVTDSCDAEDVSPEALSFVNDRHQVAALQAALGRWRVGRPPQPPPRILDLCPLPLCRLMDLGWADVSRPDGTDQSGADVTDQGGAGGTDQSGADGTGRGSAADGTDREPGRPAVTRPEGANRHLRRDGVWDAVLCAPVLSSGRLDPALMRTVRSVSVSEGGLLAPAQLQLLAVAVSSQLLLHMTSVLGENTDGFDCSAINVFRVHQLQDISYSQPTIASNLSNIHPIGHLDMVTGSVDPSRFSIPVTSSGAMHGLVYWFRPVDGSEGGGATRPENGRQMAVVLPAPRAVKAGDVVTGSVHSTADGVFIVFEE